MICQGQNQVMSLACAFRIACCNDIGWGVRDVCVLSKTSHTIRHQSSSLGSLSRGWKVSSSLDPSHQTTILSIQIHISRQRDWPSGPPFPLIQVGPFLGQLISGQPSNWRCVDTLHLWQVGWAKRGQIWPMCSCSSSPHDAN